ncbi:PAP fibrillin [Aureococcus anophagefferens]|nr:PAP fibrillin [Aureococcus anophagefferens]
MQPTSESKLMGWNDKLDAGLAHWVVCGKRGAAVRSGVAIASELVTVLAPGTAVVSAGAPTVEANLERLRLVQPAAGYVSRKVLKRVDAPETPAPIKAPALPKPPSLKTPVSAKLPLYFVNTDACGDRRALQEKQCAALDMVPRRVRAVTPTCAAYVAAQNDPRSPHMIPTDDAATARARTRSSELPRGLPGGGGGRRRRPRGAPRERGRRPLPADFARLAVLAEKMPATVTRWLWSSTYAESREQLGIPEPPGGHGVGAFYETWPRYARGAGGWKGALVITCQPGICLTTRRGAAKIADAIAAAMARERWQPFDVAMPTLGARSETDALPRAWSSRRIWR